MKAVAPLDHRTDLETPVRAVEAMMAAIRTILRWVHRFPIRAGTAWTVPGAVGIHSGERSDPLVVNWRLIASVEYLVSQPEFRADLFNKGLMIYLSSNSPLAAAGGKPIRIKMRRDLVYKAICFSQVAISVFWKENPALESIETLTVFNLGYKPEYRCSNYTHPAIILPFVFTGQIRFCLYYSLMAR